MKKAGKIVLGILAGLVLIFVIGGLMLPAQSQVERSRVIGVGPQEAFDEVNSLRNWEPWSPWAAKDPTIRSTYNDVEAGVGAESSWTSENSGTGTQRIVRSTPPSRIEMALDFGEMGTAEAFWTFEPVTEGTRVTWGFTSENEGLFARWMGLMVERFVGADYEDGLNRLATHLEGT